MKLKPPKKFIKGKISNLLRFQARIKECIDDTVVLNVWEFFGERKGFGKQEYWANYSVGFYQGIKALAECENHGHGTSYPGLCPGCVDLNLLITRSGIKPSCGGIIELWQWKENDMNRIHMKVVC